MGEIGKKIPWNNEGTFDSSQILFEFTIEIPYFTSQKNAKTIRYKRGKPGFAGGSRRKFIPFISSTDKSASAQRFLLSELQMLARRAGISQPIDVEMRLLLSFSLSSMLTKKGKINKRSGDLDNLLCAPIDALVKAKIISDDSLITEIQAFKRPGEKNIVHGLLMIKSAGSDHAK